MNNKQRILLLSIAGLVLLYALANWVMSGVVHAKKEVMVPDLKGKSLTDAVNAISAYNLGLRKEGEENDETRPAGTILRQSPPAGMAVREGKIIRVTISQGGKVLYVPSLVGQMARTAEIALRSSGLAIGEETTRYSLVGKRDEVLSQDPAAGESVERDTMVNLVISMGPPPHDVKLMADWSGKSAEEAGRWAQSNGIILDVRQEKNAALTPGMVVRQEPAPDTDITESGKAVIYVAGEAGDTAVISKTFYYEIPQGGGERSLRLTIQDENGEKEIFRGQRAPGSKLDIPIDPKGNARVRIFMNGILVEEREIK